MKRILIIAFAVLTIAGCEQMKYGQGGRNACQFVKEQMTGQRDDIESVNVVGLDTLLGDIMIIFTQRGLAEARYEFVSEGKGNFYEKLMEMNQYVYDLTNSWEFPSIYNDSLRKLEIYEECWRKVYVVEVKMKSGTSKQVKVLMENDGVTPRMLEKDFRKEINKYIDIVNDSWREISNSYYRKAHSF